MGIKEKMAVIGTMRPLEISGFIVFVNVLDYKCSWGKDRWLVTPCSGEGQIWVEADWK